MATFELANNKLIIQQGATYTLSINFKDSNGVTRDLSSYTARMQGRIEYDSDATVFSLTELSGIALAATNPNCIITMTAAITAGFDAPLFGVYDLELVNGPVVERGLEGVFEVTPEVSR